MPVQPPVEPAATVRPTPTAEEAAAITAAVDAILASGGASVPAGAGDETPAWRFSGRWWNEPVPRARSRP